MNHPDKVLCAFAGDSGEAIVLWYVGLDVQWDIDDVCGRALDRLRIPDPGEIEAALMVWEGRYSVVQSFDYDFDVVTKGEWRELTEEEWASVRKNEHPWLDEYLAVHASGEISMTDDSDKEGL